MSTGLEDALNERDRIGELSQQIPTLESITLSTRNNSAQEIRLYFDAGPERRGIVGSRLLTSSGEGADSLDESQAEWIAAALGWDPADLREFSVRMCMKHHVPIGFNGCDCE